MVHRHTYKENTHSHKTFLKFKESESGVGHVVHLETEESGAQDQPQLPETLSQKKTKKLEKYLS